MKTTIRFDDLEHEGGYMELQSMGVNTYVVVRDSANDGARAYALLTKNQLIRLAEAALRIARKG